MNELHGPVACIGECMVELREMPDGTLRRAHGGDTLNTAVYLARLGAAVDYVTALGDDAWSDEMEAAWRDEGIGCSLVHRLPGRLPGLYIIQVDAAGERRSLYWRDSAAARLLWDVLDPAALDRFGLVYLSGITLSLYGEAARARLLGALEAAQRRGAHVAFDTNFRPRNWPDRAAAQAIYRHLFAIADVILASTEDLRLLFGHDTPPHGVCPSCELVLKREDQSSRVILSAGATEHRADPVARVLDTTAAGDSFSAAYLAARLRGLTPAQAAAAGHRLAGLVVSHPGAIMPRAAMPARFFEDHA